MCSIKTCRAFLFLHHFIFCHPPLFQTVFHSAAFYWRARELAGRRLEARVEGLSVFSVWEWVTSTIGPHCLQRMRALPINPEPGAGVSSQRGDNSQHKSTLRYVGTWKHVRQERHTYINPSHVRLERIPLLARRGLGSGLLLITVQSQKAYCDRICN